jgi:hypothetical protein
VSTIPILDVQLVWPVELHLCWIGEDTRVQTSSVEVCEDGASYCGSKSVLAILDRSVRYGDDAQGTSGGRIEAEPLESIFAQFLQSLFRI